MVSNWPEGEFGGDEETAAAGNVGFVGSLVKNPKLYINPIFHHSNTINYLVYSIYCLMAPILLCCANLTPN